METFLTIFLFVMSIILILIAFVALVNDGPYDEPYGGLIVIIIGVLLLTCAIDRTNNNVKSPKIDLPEEYSQIKESDTLKGYYDSEGKLHIEFNNKRNQNEK